LSHSSRQIGGACRDPSLRDLIKSPKQRLRDELGSQATTRFATAVSWGLVRLTALGRPAMGEGVRSCPRAGCGRSARPARRATRDDASLQGWIAPNYPMAIIFCVQTEATQRSTSRIQVGCTRDITRDTALESHLVNFCMPSLPFACVRYGIVPFILVAQVGSSLFRQSSEVLYHCVRSHLASRHRDI
jgi:hypothetical protein